MTNKVAVITGATSGIGLVGAKAIAAAEFDLYLPCRNLEKGEAVKLEILSVAPESQVQVLSCEMGSLESVRQCALQIREQAPAIHLLVNNAGLVNLSLKFSDDGIEHTFAVNHLSHFLLTNLLLEPLKAANGARIVHTSSEAHYDGSAEFLDDINYKNRRYRFFKCYGDSKLANVLFSNKLARDFADDAIVSNCFHPGRVATGIWPTEKWYEKLILGPVKKFYLISPEQGAKPMLELALGDEFAKRSGEFWFEMEQRSTHPSAADISVQDKLWRLSNEMVSKFL